MFYRRELFPTAIQLFTPPHSPSWNFQSSTLCLRRRFRRTFSMKILYLFLLLLSDQQKTPHELTSFHPCLLRAHVRLRALFMFRRFTTRSDGTGWNVQTSFTPRRENRETERYSSNEKSLRENFLSLWSWWPTQRWKFDDFHTRCGSLSREKRIDMATASLGPNCANVLLSMDSCYIHETNIFSLLQGKFCLIFTWRWRRGMQNAHNNHEHRENKAAVKESFHFFTWGRTKGENSFTSSSLWMMPDLKSLKLILLTPQRHRKC